MTLKVSRSGVFKTVAAIKIRKSGAWKVVKRMLVYKTTGNPPVAGWRVFYVDGVAPPAPPAPAPPPANNPKITLSVTITPSPANKRLKNYEGSFPVNVTTDAVTAAVSNGTGPYTYQWVLLSWSGTVAPTILTPNAAATQFRRSMADFGSETATFKCKVTDSLGNRGDTNVSVTFSVSEFIDIHSTL